MNPGYPGLTNEFFRIVLVQPESFFKERIPASFGYGISRQD